LTPIAFLLIGQEGLASEDALTLGSQEFEVLPVPIPLPDIVNQFQSTKIKLFIFLKNQKYNK